VWYTDWWWLYGCSVSLAESFVRVVITVGGRFVWITVDSWIVTLGSKGTRLLFDGSCFGLAFFLGAFPFLHPAPAGMSCVTIRIKLGPLPCLEPNQFTDSIRSPLLSAAATMCEHNLMDLKCGYRSSHLHLCSWALTKWGASPDFELTILSLASHPGASTIALVAATRAAAFFHTPSTVVYGRLNLSTASCNFTERSKVVVPNHPIVMSCTLDWSRFTQSTDLSGWSCTAVETRLSSELDVWYTEVLLNFFTCCCRCSWSIRNHLSFSTDKKPYWDRILYWPNPIKAFSTSWCCCFVNYFIFALKRPHWCFL